VGIGEKSSALATSKVESGNVKLAMSHVVPDLVQKVFKGQDPLHILGKGDQVRHYTYGGDLARGIVDAMEREEARNEDFQPVDRGVDDGPRAGAVDLTKVKGPGVPFRYVSDLAFEYDVQKRVPSVEKAKRVLGFEPTTSLSEMLDEGHPLDRAGDQGRQDLADGATVCAASADCRCPNRPTTTKHAIAPSPTQIDQPQGSSGNRC